MLAVFWAGSAQGQDNQGADQPTGKKDALLIVSEPRTFQASRSYHTVAFKGHLGPVYTVAFSRDGKRIASASADKTVKIWDARTGAELLTLKGHTAKVNTVAFSPEGRRAIAKSCG